MLSVILAEENFESGIAGRRDVLALKTLVLGGLRHISVAGGLLRVNLWVCGGWAGFLRGILNISGLLLSGLIDEHGGKLVSWLKCCLSWKGVRSIVKIT